jgi:hypothetical protein
MLDPSVDVSISSQNKKRLSFMVFKKSYKGSVYGIEGL